MHQIVKIKKISSESTKKIAIGIEPKKKEIKKMTYADIVRKNIVRKKEQKQ